MKDSTKKNVVFAAILAVVGVLCVAVAPGCGMLDLNDPASEATVIEASHAAEAAAKAVTDAGGSPSEAAQAAAVAATEAVIVTGPASSGDPVVDAVSGVAGAIFPQWAWLTPALALLFKRPRRLVFATVDKAAEGAASIGKTALTTVTGISKEAGKAVGLVDSRSAGKDEA